MVKKQGGALKLLTEYRSVLWRKSALEAVPGSKGEALSSCLEQIRLTRALAEALKADNHLGEKLYRIIHAAYMTDKQPGDVGEILDEIAGRYGRVPRRTYFRLKKRAIEIMDARLSIIKPASASLDHIEPAAKCNIAYRNYTQCPN